MRYFICCFLLLVTMRSMAQKPRVFIMDAERLVALKTKFQNNDKPVVALVDSLRIKADGYQKMKMLSVMDKKFSPVSGDKHDYMSQAPYFWYDSSKPNGKPYLRRDGEHNPEIKLITDRTYIGDLENATRILSLAWYFTGEEKYAEKSAALIRNWFINAATRMNPNLEYAQAIPGINNGRGIGIIETRTLTGIADAIGLLNGSKAWTSSDQRDIQAWYGKYLNWMLNSKNGKDEHAAKNNHGTWYYVQVIDFALFEGDKKIAKQLSLEARALLDSQLTTEGKFPLELERTNALGYSSFNTFAWFQVATLAQQAGVDIWNYKTSKNSGLKKAVDWLMPYAMAEKKWTYQQIGPYKASDFYPVLVMAGNKYKDARYAARARLLEIKSVDPLQVLLYK
jgi:hypothetical protein